MTVETASVWRVSNRGGKTILLGLIGLWARRGLCLWTPISQMDLMKEPIFQSSATRANLVVHTIPPLAIAR